MCTYVEKEKRTRQTRNIDLPKRGVKNKFHIVDTLIHLDFIPLKKKTRYVDGLKLMHKKNI